MGLCVQKMLLTSSPRRHQLGVGACPSPADRDVVRPLELPFQQQPVLLLHPAQELRLPRASSNEPLRTAPGPAAGKRR